MTVAKITTHSEDAKKRLLEQYKNKPKIIGFIKSITGERAQQLEDSIYKLYSRLDFDGSEGIQLDKIGTIVKQGRNGMTDAQYRLFLKAKACVNVSEGDPERLISVWSILAQASLVQLTEQYPCGISLTANGAPPTGLEIFAYHLVQQAAAGGVRILSISEFDDNTFQYDGIGPQSDNGGYDDGKYCKDLMPVIPFAYDSDIGEDIYSQGYASDLDSLVGGRYTE